MNMLPANQGGKPVRISTKQIAETTSKLHKHVLRDTRKMLVDLYGHENQTFEDLLQDGPTLDHGAIEVLMDGRGEYVAEIIMDGEHALTLATGYDVKLRKMVVDKVAELSQQRGPHFSVPQSFSEALRLAAKQAGQIERQQAVITEMAPKAEFHDEVAASINGQEFSAVAKELGTGRTRLTSWLKSRKILMGNLRPYQPYLDAGYFRVAPKTRKDRNTGEIYTYSQTLVLGKGLIYLRKKWIEDHGPIRELPDANQQTALPLEGEPA